MKRLLLIVALSAMVYGSGCRVVTVCTPDDGCTPITVCD